MNRFLMTACAAMVLASGAVAQQAMTPAQIPAGVGVKRMYINLRTGERRITEVTSRVGDLVWGYDPNVDNSGFYAPTWGDGGYGWNDTEIWDSGALNGDATIDGVQVWYQAGGTQPADSTFPLAFAVSDDYQICAGLYPTLTSGVFGIDAPADPAFSWIIDIDLAGFEFNLTAGHDFGYGLFADVAAAVDGAGNPVTLGPTGLIIVNDNPTTAPGAVDAFEGLDVDAAGAGCWFFGGAPFAQFYFNLYGTGGGSGCPADFNGDGFLDFFDYDDFIACFQDGICPPGKDADFNGDLFVDFFDYDDFVAAFEAGC